MVSKEERKLVTDKEAKVMMEQAINIAYEVEYGESYDGHEAAGADRTDAARMMRVGMLAAAIFARLKP